MLGPNARPVLILFALGLGLAFFWGWAFEAAGINELLRVSRLWN